MAAVIILIVLGTTIWVAFDASSIGAGKRSGTTGPAAWFLFCLLLWIVGFPVYLANRSKIKAAAALAGAAHPNDTNLTVVGPLPPPQPVWPPGPTAHGQQQLYWDGTGSGTASRADELTKLDALRQSGALSQEEFDAEKVKLLS
jgi:hypothetical protein